MSIKYNGKTIAGGYVPKVSSDLEYGIIRIATNEEVRQGRSNDVAITPKQLNDFGGRANLFDTKILDYVLPYEKSEGWALQGTYVYKTAILNERYGYPTFIEECIKQKNQSIPTEVTLGSSVITMYIHDNGHIFYDISDKDVVDTWYNTYGIADFYGVDTENECVFLPRNNYFMQLTCDITKVNKFNEAGLPTLTTNSTGAHTHTRGTMDIKGEYYGIYDNQPLGAESGAHYSGAFYKARNAGSRYASSTADGVGGSLGFQASKNWTGATSSNGAHTHTISGTSDTVQPPSSNKLLYYCVGNTISDTSWIDTVTQTANGVQEIEDKRASSLEDIETARLNAVTNIEADRANAITNIETDRLNAVNEIEVDRSSAVLEINTDRANAVDEIEQHRKQALTDLINTENEGISALANASNALRQTQITNCIIEIPQRIKYILEDGTLTIKAGSVIIVPYGTEDLSAQYPVGATFLNDNFKVYDTQYTEDTEGNGKFFVWAEIQNDRSIKQQYNSENLLISFNISGDVICTNPGKSGTATPEATTTHINFYNTSENKCFFDVGSWNQTTLPIMVVDRSAEVGFIKVKQVFNGIGYIGSTYWVDKGVKGLIPNGRNEDGTLNNIRFAPDKFLTYTFSSTLTFANANFAWGEDVGRLDYMGFSSTAWSYDEQDNYNKFRGLPLNWLPLGKCDLTAGVISNYHPKQPFRAVDQNSIWYDSSTSTLYIGV